VAYKSSTFIPESIYGGIGVCGQAVTLEVPIDGDEDAANKVL
jgi:hypothetical protein